MPKFQTAMKYGEKVFTKGCTVQFNDNSDVQDFVSFCKPGEKFENVIGRTGVVKKFATTKSAQCENNKNRPVLVQFFSKYGCDVEFWLHPSWLDIIDAPVVADEADGTED